jgi:Fic family protein
MFVPEYSITPRILKNIGTTEYSKALIDNSAILPAWRDNLVKEAKINTIFTISQLNGINVLRDSIKEYVDNVSFIIPQESKNLVETHDLTKEITKRKELEEKDVKSLHKNITINLIPKTKQGVYRSIKFPEKPAPDELLAKISEVFDWYNSIDGKETHPVIKTAIIRGVFEAFQPFEFFNDMTAEFVTYVILKMNGYGFNDYICISNYYLRTQRGFEQSLSSLVGKDPDFTKWIEYFSEAVAFESTGIKERTNLLEKDTKVAKASGRVKLSKRQEKIISHLQDYGIFTNKDFPKIFPNISEDTVLRELKGLIKQDIIVKKGKTKSSRYELK